MLGQAPSDVTVVILNFLSSFRIILGYRLTLGVTSIIPRYFQLVILTFVAVYFELLEAPLKL